MYNKYISRHKINIYIIQNRKYNILLLLNQIDIEN